MKAGIDGDSLVYTIGFACQKNIHQVVDAADDTVIYFESERKDMCLGYIEDHPEHGATDIAVRIEVSPPAHAFHSLKIVIQKIAKCAKAQSYKIYLTGSGNFREGVATVMGYKHNRIGKPKPMLYDAIREYLQVHHKAAMVTGMEADDALAIVHQRHNVDKVKVNTSVDPNNPNWIEPEEFIICAIDKDLRNIPGNHINFSRHVAEDNGDYKFVTITEEEGRHTFWKQVLTGDTADNIIGIPRMGEKGADALLDPIKFCFPEDPMEAEKAYFNVVYDAYKKKFGAGPVEYFHYDAYVDTSKGYTKRVLKEEADILPEQRLVGSALTFLLENARLAWMLRYMPNAEGTHWWMPPYTFDEIAALDALEAGDTEETPNTPTDEEENERDVDIPWTEGRGKWFYITKTGDTLVKAGPFGTAKKAKADLNSQPDESQTELPFNETDDQQGAEIAAAEHCLSKGAPHPPEPEIVSEPVDPVHQAWYFWDETWADRYGPFDTEEEARTQLDAYVKGLNGLSVLDETNAGGFPGTNARLYDNSEVMIELPDNGTDIIVKEDDVPVETLPKSPEPPTTEIWNESF